MLHGAVEFHTVTGREDDALTPVGIERKLLQRLLQVTFGEMEALAQFNRRGFVAQTDDDDVHPCQATPLKEPEGTHFCRCLPASAECVHQVAQAHGAKSGYHRKCSAPPPPAEIPAPDEQQRIDTP